MEQQSRMISPGAFVEMVKRTLLVMLGRRPFAGSYDASPDGVWQAIWASVVITTGIGISLKMTIAVGSLVSYVLFELIQIIAVVLVLNAISAAAGDSTGPAAFWCRFVAGKCAKPVFGLCLNSMVLTGDYTLGILFVGLGAWSIYWMWRAGQDILGRGGLFATGLLVMTYIIHLLLALFNRCDCLQRWGN